VSRPHGVAVLGGTGYVAGEFLRLLAGHPSLALAAVSSESRAGQPVAAMFPNLAQAFPQARFCNETGLEDAVRDGRVRALFCAAPHGAAAARIDALLQIAAAAGVPLTVVDVSADFRFRDAAAYARVYGHAHPCPARLTEFASALPEHLPGRPAPHVAHPGCFVTSVLLGIVPLLAAGLAEPEFFVSAVTGSTGVGRKLGETTHHPERHGNMFAYQPLVHRHRPEIEQLAAAAAAPCTVHFVPHSGPLGARHSCDHSRAPRDARERGRAARSTGRCLRRLALRRSRGHAAAHQGRRRLQSRTARRGDRRRGLRRHVGDR
jgi:N-acetyl-gamma-glutamyl-phosphate reductase common form